MSEADPDIKTATNRDPCHSEAGTLDGLINALISAIELEFEGASLWSVASEAIATGGSWFATPQGHSFRLACLHGNAPMLTENRITAAVTALEAAESILDALESRLGIILEPHDLANDLPQSAKTFSVLWALEGSRVHQIDLALLPSAFDLADLAKRAAALPVAPDTPIAFDLSFTAAHIDLDEAANLEAGDLLLLGNPAAARIFWPDGTQAGVIDLATGAFTCSGHDEQEGAGFAVPVTASVMQQSLAAKMLFNVQPGSMLSLQPLLAGKPLQLSIGGRAVAAGEVVLIGSQFAVHITSLAEQASAGIMVEQG